MIEVTITAKGGKLELGRIQIENISPEADELGDYTVQFAVDRCMAVGMHQRAIYSFPRTRYNVLALLLQALNTLDPKELRLEDDTSSSDLARRQRGTLPALQGGSSRLRNHGPAFWRRQPEQHGGDRAGEEVRPEDRQ